jgi:hypothetical protein
VGRRSSDEGSDKKTPVKLRQVPRKHAGKITEPWAIMERLIAECECLEHLKVCKIRLWWQKDWKADVDGIATGAQVCKASELDRNLVEETNGETVDVFIKLPERQWPSLDETEKEHRLFHELLRVMPAKDANGEQKMDSKDRLLWRIRRFPITAFHEEIDRYGVEKVIHHDAAISQACSDADRPLMKLFDRADLQDSAWKRNGLAAAGLSEKQVDALEEAGIRTLGGLQEAMRSSPVFWAKNLKVHGRLKEGIEQVLNEYLTEMESAKTA